MTQMPVRVLHILGELRPSGMERMLEAAHSEFVAQGCDSTIYGLAGASPYATLLRRAGYEVILSTPVGASATGLAQLRRIVSARNINLIHIHTEADYLRTVVAARLALGRSGAIVRTVHSIFHATGRWRLQRTIQSVVGDRLVAATVAPSVDVARSERRIGRRTKVIMNWVDPRFEGVRAARATRPADAKPTQAAIVGNCSRIKNHELALTAALSAGVRVFHVGDETGASSREKGLLAALAARGLLAGRGAQTPDEALTTSDMFLQPSLFEGMGVALAEAITAGLPCIISDVPGHAWATEVGTQVSALPLDPGQWARAIAAAERRIYPPPTVDLSLGRGVAEYVATYRRALHMDARS